MNPLLILVLIVWAVSGVGLIVFVLLHSGKGTGVSDMIASSLYNSSAATGVMEQNLDKLTVIVAVVFAICVVLPLFFFPQGINGMSPIIYKKCARGRSVLPGRPLFYFTVLPGSGVAVLNARRIGV